MIYDIALVLIVLIFVIVGYKKGAGKTLVFILSNCITFVLSSFLGRLLANFFYDRAISQTISNKINEAINTTSVKDLSNNIDNIIDSLPGYIKTILNISGTDTKGLLENSLGGAANTVVSSVDSVLKPIIVGFFTFLLSIIFFLIIAFIFRVTINKLLIRLLNIGPLSIFNSILGAILGIIRGLIFIVFVAFLLKCIMPYFDNIPDILSESSIFNSFIFYYFYNGNIINNILSVFNGGCASSSNTLETVASTIKK